jgi:DUF917 family protein
MRVSATWLEDAVWGGAILGGGTGGTVAEGRALGRAIFAADRPEIIHPEDMGSGLVAACSVSIAPQSSDRCVLPGHHVRAVELLREHLSGELVGLIPEAPGARALLDGWYPSAVLGLPVVDLPGDGRGHPLDLQGMLGLTHDDSYISWQACAGGDPETNRYLEVYVSGSIEIAEKLTRRAAAQAGGAVSVARNPMPLEYAVQGGVPGGIHAALELGRDYLKALRSGVESAVSWLADRLEGNLQGRARVTGRTEGYQSGLDTAVVEMPPFSLSAAVTWLEAYREGHQVAAYPDLVVVLDCEEGRPLSVDELVPELEVWLVTVPADRLRLGAGSRDSVLLDTVDSIASRLRVRPEERP